MTVQSQVNPHVGLPLPHLALHLNTEKTENARPGCELGLRLVLLRARAGTGRQAGGSEKGTENVARWLTEHANTPCKPSIPPLVCRLNGTCPAPRAKKIQERTCQLRFQSLL